MINESRGKKSDWLIIDELTSLDRDMPPDATQKAMEFADTLEDDVMYRIEVDENGNFNFVPTGE